VGGSSLAALQKFTPMRLHPLWSTLETEHKTQMFRPAVDRQTDGISAIFSIFYTHHLPTMNGVQHDLFYAQHGASHIPRLMPQRSLRSKVTVQAHTHAHRTSYSIPGLSWSGNTRSCMFMSAVVLCCFCLG